MLKSTLWGDAAAVVTVQVSRLPVWRTLLPRPHCHSHQTTSFLSLIGTRSQQPTKIKICLPQVSFWCERKHAFQTRTKLSHSPAVNGPGLHAASPASSSCLQVMEQGRAGLMAFWSAQLVCHARHLAVYSELLPITSSRSPLTAPTNRLPNPHVQSPLFYRFPGSTQAWA